MPEVLRKLKNAWFGFARKFVRVQTVIILTLFYFLIIAPAGLVMTLLGWDPLDRRAFQRQVKSNWKQTKQNRSETDSLRHQS